MPGTDSSYMWQAMIPQDEIPFQYNPERGFVSSANQRPVDSAYPYYLGREYPVSRGAIINRKLSGMQNITPQDMMAMQTDNYNIFAEWTRPLLLNNIVVQKLDQEQKKYLDHLYNWDLQYDIHSKGATVFELTWQSLHSLLYKDEYARAPVNTAYPMSSTLMEALLKDSAYVFIDNIETPAKETLADVVTDAFKIACTNLKKAEADNKLVWGKFKDTHINHLAKEIVSFSRFHLPIGGGANVINATKESHGPSWRMIVSLTKDIEAYGVYPGGQSGNPGSSFYDNAIDQWAGGKYYRLWMMKKEEGEDRRIKRRMRFKNS
jgi:penicillin amidase